MGERLDKFLSRFKSSPEQAEKKAETRQLIQQVRTVIETGRVSELDTTQMAEDGAPLEVLRLVRKAQDDEKIKQTRALIAAGRADELDPARMAADGYPEEAIKIARKAQKKDAVQAVKEIIKAGKADELDVTQMVTEGLPIAAVKKARKAQAGRGKAAKVVIAAIKAPVTVPIAIGSRIARQKPDDIDGMSDEELFGAIDKDVELGAKPEKKPKEKKGKKDPDDKKEDDKGKKNDKGKTKTPPPPPQNPNQPKEGIQYFGEYLSNPNNLILKSRIEKIGALYKLLSLHLTQEGQQGSLLEYLGFTKEMLTKYFQVMFGNCGNETLRTEEGVIALIEQDERSRRVFSQTLFNAVLLLEGKSPNAINAQCERLHNQMQRLQQIFQLRDMKGIFRIIKEIRDQEKNGRNPTLRDQLAIVRVEGSYEKDGRGDLVEVVDVDGRKKVVTTADREAALAQNLAEIERILGA